MACIACQTLKKSCLPENTPASSTPKMLVGIDLFNTDPNDEANASIMLDELVFEEITLP